MIWLTPFLGDSQTFPDAHRLRPRLDRRSNAPSNLQRDALQTAGCERIFKDTASSAAERPGLRDALDQLRAGDTLVCLASRPAGPFAQGPDRTRRSVAHPDSGSGRLIFHIFGALAEFERVLIRKRTQAGLQAARARGRQGGRRKRLDVRQRAHAVELYRSRRHTVKEIWALMGISRATLYAYVEEFADGP